MLVYNIEVKNPEHVNRGVSVIWVDGSEIKGNVAPPFGDCKEHKVKVILGQ